MEQVAQQFGLDWKLLLSGVNFGILLVILTRFVYRPLLNMMKERQARIEFGLHGAEEAEKKLNEIEKIKIEKLAEADRTALARITDAEKKAEDRAHQILTETDQRVEEQLAEGTRIGEQRAQEAFEKLTKEAHAFVRETISKTVGLRPAEIDGKLIDDALRTVKESKI